MMLQDDIISKALTAVTIEKTLLALGEPAYDKVAEMLYKKYHCYLPDCYDHPEYLSRVLNELFGNASKAIVESIETQLKEFTEHKRIEEFLRVIAR